MQTEPRARYERDGFMVLANLFPNELLERAHRAAMDVAAGRYATGALPASRIPEVGDDADLVKVAQPHDADNTFTELITHPALGAALAEVLDVSLLQAWAVDLFVKRPGGQSAGNVGWHQDARYMRDWRGDVCTAWIALSEVSAESSPLIYVRGSHRFGSVEGVDFFSTDLVGVREEICRRNGVEWEEVPVIVERGGVAVHHRHTIHASGPNTGVSTRAALAVRLRTDRCSPDLGSPRPFVRHLDDHRRAPLLTARAR